MSAHTRHAGWTSKEDARTRETTTVQLLPRLLREGLLPLVAVGGTITTAPVVYVTEVDRLRCRPRTLWDTDRYGLVVACGRIGPPRVVHDEDGTPHGLEVLEVGERRVPVNLGGLDSPETGDPSTPVYLEGSYYLDVDVAAAGASVPGHGTYRVTAVRRYVPGPPGGPPREDALRRIPGPDEIDADAFLHVADLVGPVRDQP